MKIYFDDFNNFLEHAAQQPTYVFDIIPEMGSMMFEKCYKLIWQTFFKMGRIVYEFIDPVFMQCLKTPYLCF